MSDPFVGQRILVECEFRYRGVPTDPNLVTVRSHAPSGSEATLTYPNVYLTRRDEGVFEASFLVDESGTWTFRAEGTGVVDAVNEYKVFVQSSGMN